MRVRARIRVRVRVRGMVRDKVRFTANCGFLMVRGMTGGGSFRGAPTRNPYPSLYQPPIP